MPAPSAQRRDTTFARSMLAGAAAACGATVTFHPLDTVKTVLQRQGGQGRGLYVNKIQALGLRGLYRGVMPAAFSMATACAVRMGSYEVAKEALLVGSMWSVLPPGAVSIALASAFSVVISAVVRSPLDMVKTQLQAGAVPSSSAALHAAWGHAGFLGLYRGAGLALMRDVPFFSINLVLYEHLRALAVAEKSRRFGSDGNAAQLSPAEAILTGAVSQGTAGFITNPIDVLKTRVQAGPRGETMRSALRAVLKEATGAAGLMSGAGMRVAWIAPQGCVYYPVYELVQQWR